MSTIVDQFGFCADPSQPTWKNLEDYLLQLPTTSYFSQATNKACHNYCTQPDAMPRGIPEILSLGLKYCIQKPRPSNCIDTTIERFANDVRRKSYFRLNEPVDDGQVRYIPGLYIKSTTEWRESEIPGIEECLARFESTLREERVRYLRPQPSNLRPRQWRLAWTLKNHDDFIVIEADKNLGGCFLLRRTYIERGVREHLGDQSVYRRLTKHQAMQFHHVTKYKIMIFTTKYKDLMTEAENSFLLESLRMYPDNIARFRMSLKAHKTPWKMRPIVSCCGTALNYLSRWLDHHLQKVKPFVKSYVRDSSELLLLLKDLGPLPAGAKVFTADANSMYTNIDTCHAINVIGAWLDSLEGDLPGDFPLAAVKEAMVLVMTSNLFEWGDLYFLQLLGTAMGTSAACMWATIYFAVHENGTLLENFQLNLLLFRRFIDDIFGIWIPLGDDTTTWKAFKDDTNNFGILTWDFEEPSDCVNFLDLTISIEDSRIVTKTYQKSMNLYQYIMPQSNHPPRMMKGIIYSLMRNYHRQNTKFEDYRKMARLHFQRHADRGWDKKLVKSWIIAADEKIQATFKDPVPIHAPAPNPDLDERLFIHFEYHKNDIPKSQVRRIYDQTCKDLFQEALGVEQLTIAYSRSMNLQELLTKGKLHQAAGQEASKYYLGELPHN